MRVHVYFRADVCDEEDVEDVEDEDEDEAGGRNHVLKICRCGGWYWAVGGVVQGIGVP